MTATLTPRTTTVTLLQGDEFDSIIESAEAVDQAVKTSPVARVGDSTDAITEAAESFNEFMAAANDRAVKVKLRALGRKAFRVLLNEHPERTVEGEEGPRPHPDDDGWGFNRDTFGDALVAPCVEAGELDDPVEQMALTQRIVDKVYEPRPETTAFLDSLSDGDFSKLYAAAVTLNRGPGPDPKSRISSPRAQTSDETSSSPERLG